MPRCGLLGETLGHSYSPMLHGLLGDPAYRLFECPREQLENFLQNGPWDGLNVTIPYKKLAAARCDVLSPEARLLGSVNTLIRRPDGTLYGDNTDYFGFRRMALQSGIPIRGKKALVLGSGGASVTVCAVLRELGAASVTVISRSGPDNYQNLDRHRDAQLLVNTTPVGMYPACPASPVELRAFPACEGVLDIVYNPARTGLMLQAEALGIPCCSGLPMLAAQAKRSRELFTGRPIPESEIDRAVALLRQRLENIILIGMPGCGKSTVAAALGERLGRPVLDADQVIAEQAGMSIPEIFARQGEAGFRALETRVLAELGKRSGILLATGGGCVTREDNYPLLHQNGTIFWLQRSLDALPTQGRPISQATPLDALFARREPLYRRFADRIIDNNGPLAETLKQMEEYA